MRYFIWLVIGSCLVQMACGAVPGINRSPVTPASGRLCKYSQQTTTCSKKIIFLHGRALNITDPNGPDLAQMESLFSSKVVNFNSLCQDKYHQPLTNLAEVWYYGYYPGQDIAKIAGDLVQSIHQQSAFKGSTVALVGYSQGGVVAWLVDQRYLGTIAGGVLLGAPKLSTPLAHKAVRDMAVQKVFPLASAKLIPIFDQLTNQSDNLAVSYPESGRAKTPLLMFAGILPPHPPTFWQRNVDILDALVAKGGNFLSDMQDDHQFAELGATLINNAEWQTNATEDRQSDGLVPVSSAVWGATEAKLLADHDHYDLLSGQSDMSLDQTTFEWLDRVLKLAPDAAGFTQGGSVPNLPEISIVTPAVPLAKFAYVKSGQIVLADTKWQNLATVATTGASSFPRFSAAGSQLVWTQTEAGTSNIYRLDGTTAKSVTTDGKSCQANFSPDGKWLTYQSGADLVIRRLEDNKCYTVVSGVNLIMPPVWLTANQLWGHIYFVSRDAAGKTSLYWVGPRVRQAKLTDTNLVASDCQAFCLVHAPIVGGIIALRHSTNEAFEKLWVASNAWAGLLSLEITPADRPGLIPLDNTGHFQLQLDDEYYIESVGADWDGQRIYFDNTAGRAPGIYAVDFSAYQADAPFEDCFRLVAANATQFDLNPAASP